MFKRTKLNAGLALAFGTSMLLAGLPAAAQQQVEVTGSRIRSIGAVSNSPIASITSEEIKATQSVAVEEIIRNLPAAVPAIGPGVNNGAGGGATIDLRGLGPQRTLVLIDGKRFVPFDLNARVDTNSIPLALLSRIDVVTGGASAVYGADAVAGVVNFMLKKDFSGLEASTSYGLSDKGDAVRRRIDLTMGSNLADGKGNIVFSVGKTTTEPLLVGSRDIGKTTTSSSTGLFAGSATTMPVVISVPQASSVTSANNTLGTGNRQLDLASGSFKPYVGATGGFNTNPDNYFVTPLDRTQLTALGTYNFNQYAEAYAQLFYTKSVVNLQLAASGTFGNSFTVPIGNPYLPAAARQQICAARGISAADCVVGNTTPVTMSISRRFVELGPRFNDFENNTFQSTVGVRGDLVKGWTYDAYFTNGTSSQDSIRRNWGSLSKVQQALNAVSTTACVNSANGCVPLNIFGAAGTVTQPMLDFINLSSVVKSQVTQQVANVSASGDLGAIKSPLAKSPIGLAVGLEDRKVSAQNASDGASQIQGEVLGTGAPTPDRKGTYKLKEAFLELNLPLVEKMPFAYSLGLEAGFRHTSFSTNSSTSYNSSKYGGEWAPIKGLRFRGMLQNATRAPNVNELFAPQVTNLSNLSTDPCQGTLIKQSDANTAGTLSNLCRLTGVPSTIIGSLPAPSSGQINQLAGGNPNLGPEKAKTTTFGFVFEPEMVKNLMVSVDYYRINITDSISNPSTTDVLDQCYNTKYNPSFALVPACAGIFRSPLTGTFNGVDSKGVLTIQSNQGKNWTSGVDVTVNYSLGMKDLGLDAKLGKLDLSLSYNTVGDNDFQATPTTDRRKCKGFYSNACGAPNFANKFSQRTVWSVGDFVLSYNWRHVSGMVVEPGSGTWVDAYSSIPAYDYVDLGAVWNYSKTVRLSLGINNAFNKQPPVVGNTIATTATNGGNTLPSTYDTVGRYFTLGASVKF